MNQISAPASLLGAEPLRVAIAIVINGISHVYLWL